MFPRIKKYTNMCDFMCIFFCKCCTSDTAKIPNKESENTGSSHEASHTPSRWESETKMTSRNSPEQCCISYRILSVLNIASIGFEAYML